MIHATARSVVLIFSLACLSFSYSSTPSSNPATSPAVGATGSTLTVHEWGTFTSVADRTGRAVRWKVQGGFDLPNFVQHYHMADYKAGLRGTIRMETPVLYFYSPTETTVSVRVNFSRGVISEWYPAASRIHPDPEKVLGPDALFAHSRGGSIAWDSVTVEPGLTPNFPHDNVATHYYTARETAADPVVVNTPLGVQQEKFLFYRGVSVFPVPVAAQSLADGAIRVSNVVEDVIPGVILFERRGQSVGYRVAGAVSNETEIEAPELTSNVDSVSRELETMLISQGLYAGEARAMVKTWRDSWFEEGSRLIYIVPRSFVDTILPLSIAPAPDRTTRVFVGRLELITPTTERAVETALAAHDVNTIERYGRFLQPIMDQLKSENPAQAKEFEKELSDTYAAAR